MGKKTTLLAEANNGKEIRPAFEKAKGILEAKLGLKVAMQSDAQLQPLVQKMTSGKRAQFQASFDGQFLLFEVTIAGSVVQEFHRLDIKSLGDAMKQYPTLLKLSRDPFKLVETPTDPKDQMAKAKEIKDLEDEIKKSKDLKTRYTNLTYATTRTDQEIKTDFETFAKSKSMAQYLEFLVDVGSPSSNPQTIFDEYIKQGARKKVNLSAATVAKIAQDLKAKKKPDFAAAKNEILAAVNTKLIAPFKQDRIGKVSSNISTKEAQLKQKKSQ